MMCEDNEWDEKKIYTPEYIYMMHTRYVRSQSSAFVRITQT